ncbi:MAG TPA: pitrilysin family protein [Streptosporangiaceae bacterium]|jgi:predicted Zn-dependent peptidase
MTVDNLAPRPPLADATPYHFPAVHRSAVGAGRVVAVDLPGHPLVALRLVHDAGAASEPLDAAGVAQLTAESLRGGEHGDGELVPELERHGAVWNSSASWDSFVTGIDVPVNRLADATELLARTVRHPALRPDDVTRRRDQLVEQLRIEAAWPDALAARMVGGELYTGRFSVPRSGTPDLLAKVTPDVVAAFHAERVATAPGTLVVVGDLGRIDAEALAGDVFSGCAASPAAVGADAGPAAEPTPRIVVVDRPGSVQSALMLAHRAPARAAADVPLIYAVSDVLGGMFTSRLSLELRERRGYTYGVNSRFELRRDGGVFATACQVATGDTADAVTVTVAETRRLIADGIDDAELDAVRTHNVSGMPVTYATPQAIAEALVNIVVYDLPDDHVDRMRAGYEALTRDSMREAAAAYLHPDDLVAIVVGDASEVAPGLEAGGLGPVRVRQA